MTTGKPFALSMKVLISNGDGLCLLLRRSQSSQGNPGKWDFPGGKIDPGESFDQALLREVSEETGLSITLDRLAGTSQFELPQVKVIFIIMEGQVESGSLRLSSEHDAYSWVDPRELHDIDLAEQFKSFARGYSQRLQQ